MSILSGLYDDDFIMELERISKIEDQMEKWIIYDLKTRKEEIVCRGKLKEKLKSIQLKNNYTDDQMENNICYERVY